MLFYVCCPISAVRQLIIERLHLKSILIFLICWARRITAKGYQALNKPAELPCPALEAPLKPRGFKEQAENQRGMDGPERPLRCKTWSELDISLAFELCLSGVLWSWPARGKVFERKGKVGKGHLLAMGTLSSAVFELFVAIKCLAGSGSQSLICLRSV